MKHYFDAKDYVYMPLDVYEKLIDAINKITIVSNRRSQDFSAALELINYTAKGIDGAGLQKILDEYEEMVNERESKSNVVE